jgi:glycosyltransferase involved in cell wall biosynthesis
MAAGLPLIATDIAGNPEILASGSGIQVPCGDVRAFADAMLKMLENPELREKCGKAAVEAANGTFNMKTMLIKTKEIYGG